MRLAFSVAVHVDPDVLVIDEVIGVGDQAFFAKCLERMRRFQSGGQDHLAGHAFHRADGRIVPARAVAGARASGHQRPVEARSLEAYKASQTGAAAAVVRA